MMRIIDDKEIYDLLGVVKRLCYSRSGLLADMGGYRQADVYDRIGEMLDNIQRIIKKDLMESEE